MQQLSLVGIDLAKNVFQVCALNRAGQVVSNRSVRRAGLLDRIRQLAPPLIAMEACGSAHHWGRVLEAEGIPVRLIPPQHCKPFVRGGKSDARDALAICEAASRPELHPVPVKCIAQQDLQLLGRVRTRQVRELTALCNQVRAIAAEYGVVFPVGRKALMKALPEALEDADNGLSPEARELIAALYAELAEVRRRVDSLALALETLAKIQPAYARLQAIPGVGPIVAAALLAAVGDGRQFRNGRQMAAWLGLVPRQHGSGGHTRLLGITKQGGRELRTLIIHGARAAIRWQRGKDTPLGRWIDPLIARRGLNKACVALANKIARIAWSVLAEEQDYDQRRAFGTA